jgi:hypothetical protein
MEFSSGTPLKEDFSPAASDSAGPVHLPWALSTPKEQHVIVWNGCKGIKSAHTHKNLQGQNTEISSKHRGKETGSISHFSGQK